MSKSTGHILIIDDEPNVRLVFRTALTSAGYSVFTAEDGIEGLKAARDSHPDLVLLDLNMPGLDGMEVLKRLRDEGNAVPVVIVTAHGDIPNAVQAMKLGAIDFLSKPLSPDALRNTVAEVLERAETATPEAALAKDEPVSAATEFVRCLTNAKHQLTARRFSEAEIYLKQAIALFAHSAEAHNLMGVLHELRNEHDASYQSYKASLKADRHYDPAQHNMKRYYERFTFGKSSIPIDQGA